MTYNENIERLKQASTSNTSLANRYETEHANAVGNQRIQEARDIANGLSDFSKTLKVWQEKEKGKALERGKQQARQHATEDALKLVELQQKIKTVQEQDTRFHEMKAEMLRLSGPDVYPEADRLAKLSPWAQVGYAQEKLRVFNDSFDDRLAYMMQNSDQAITIQGVTFTPRELRQNNITGLPFKEAAVQLMSEQIKEESGIYKFSPELLALAGTNKSVQAAKDGQMEKFRERYNIDASMQTRAQAVAEWDRSEKTGSDLQRFFLQQAATVNEKNQILGNVGGWNSVFDKLTEEGVALADPGYADTIGNLPIPPDMAIQLGVKPGTTFKEHWPQRFNKLKTQIRSGYVKATDAELKFQKAEGTKLEAAFIEEARQKPLSAQEVNAWKRKFGQAGLPIPSGVTNYETASDRDQREDEAIIDALMAANKGRISHAELDQFHPAAALKHRDKADKFEKASLQEFDAEKKIKAHMDVTFTNMGIKSNEKSPAYVEAMANAKADYALKYNTYIGMGYSRAQASHMALHANEVTDQEGNALPDSMGVIAEIKANGESSKYVITGQSIEKEIQPGHLRVARVASGKREIIEDPNIIINGTIGGDYGKRQLDSVIANIEKHGSRKGLYLNQGAIQYYKGLARGRDGNWMGLLDSQLKATGHEGLWPKGKPEIQSLLDGDDGQGTVLEGEEKRISQHISRSSNYPSKSTYLYNKSLMKDGRDKSILSDFDRSENLLVGVV